MKNIKTAKAEISLLKDNIVRMQILDYTHLEEEDVVEFNHIKKGLVGNNIHKVLLVSGKYTTISKEAREFSGKREIGENRIAKAIVVNSLAQALIANFFVKFQKSQSKVKVFSREDEALLWLKSVSAHKR